MVSHSLTPRARSRASWSVLLALALLLSMFGGLRAQAQNAADAAVQVSATVQASPIPQIVLSWPSDPNATSYQVYRKSRDATSWGAAIPLPGTATGYTDLTVSVGQGYEYQILCSDSKVGQATGYIYSGINVPMTEKRGTVILVVEQSMAVPLAKELNRLQQDLVGDGWTVVRHDVGRDQNLSADYPGAPPPVREPNDKGVGAANLKALIVADYNADPNNVKAVFLFGHVPIAFSGDLNPDGHPDHEGAWPADVYYGDMTGAWTDTQNFPGTYNTNASVNTAGDGSFDQSFMPAQVKLAVGRVDLYAMPAYAPKTETDLLRQYLDKDHAFRVAQMTAQRRGITDAHFGYFGGEAFGANAYRNFPPFFGPSSITDISGAPISWLPTLDKNSYLWGEADSGGAPNGMQDIVNVGLGDGSTGINDGQPSDDYSQHNPQVVFNMLFGSYFGDWTFGSFYQQTTFDGNGSSNNLLRAPLANGDGLTDVWAGRPNWFFHHMALGETIGFSTVITQNNGLSGLYQPAGFYASYIHVALMGDPTLRLHPVAPATSLTAPIRGSAEVSWTASTDPAVSGYHVYRAATSDGPFTRLTTVPTTSTTFLDTTAQPGNSYSYMVRAIKLETSGSGTYFNPSQGAFVTVPVTQLQLSGVSVDPTAVAGGVNATGTVTLNQPAPSGGIVVALSSSDPSASVPANVTVLEGSTTATFTVTTIPVNASRSVTLTASYNGVSQNATLQVQLLSVASVSFSPASVVEGGASTGTVTLNGPAPNGDATVSLSSDTAAVPVPLTVTVLAGSMTATFTVTTGQVSAATDGHVTADLNNAPQTGVLTVTPVQVSSLVLDPAVVFGGSPSKGTVTLSSRAPTGGLTVTLASGDPSASVPGSVAVAAGASTAVFAITTQPVGAAKTAVITSSLNGSAQAQPLAINPILLSGLTLVPNGVFEGDTVTGTVDLNSPAPAGGQAVSLSSDNTALPVPATVTVPAGASTAYFTLTAGPVSATATVTVTATLNGSTQQASATVKPLRVSSLTLAPAQVFGGNSSTATVTLTGPAPAGGASVALSSSDPSASVPAAVTVLQGSTSATFTVNTSAVALSTTATITASFRGAAQTAALTIGAYAVTGLTLNPGSVTAGSASTGVITLNNAAPAGGLSVSLSSDSGAVAVPPTVLVPAGRVTATFAAATRAVTAVTSATLRAAVPGGAQTAALTVRPNGVVSLSLNPASASPGTTVLGRVTLDGAAPDGGQVVSLSSANSGLAPVPVGVTVPAGQISVTFSIPVGAAIGTVPVLITASESGSSLSATLTVEGVTLSSLAFDSAQVRAGQPASGTVTLSGLAPSGGVTVSLTSGSQSVTVPATVSVPAGVNSARFTVGTSAVSAAVTVNVTGQAGGRSATGQLTVVPVPGTVFGTGIRMISVPMDFPGVPVDQVLGTGIKLYRWMPSVLAYAVMPNAPANEIRLGHGYWLRSSSGATVTRQGTPADTTQDFSIPLEKGWNQIGDPFFSSVALSSLKVVAGGRTVGIGQAGSPVDSPVYVYNPPAGGAPGQYQSAASVDPGQGYWIHVNAAATLIVPHP